MVIKMYVIIRIESRNLMSKKGFTLIELLAVIVILAIITLIAVPMVTDVIYQVEKKAFENTVYGIIRATEYYEKEREIDFNKTTEDMTFTCDGVSCQNENRALTVSGKVPNYGIIKVIGSGDISAVISNNKWCAIKSPNSSLIEIDKCENIIFINSIEDLVSLAQKVDNGENQAGKTYVLMKSLDFNDINSYIDHNGVSYGDINQDQIIESVMVELTSSTGWNPIGNRYSSTNTALFAGIFNGFGNEINNLYIFRSESGQGLFANVSGLIKNLYVKGVINTAANTTGLIAANIIDGTIDNCIAEGVIESSAVSSYAGLLVGQMQTGTQNSIITNSKAIGTIIGNDIVGGMVGLASASAKIENSTSIVTVTGNNHIGGIVGTFNSPSEIKNCHSESTVNGVELVGGITGRILKGTKVDNCSTNSMVTGDKYVGGLIGRSSGTVYNSYTKGTVKGQGSGPIGGLIGLLYGEVKNSYSSTNVISTLSGSGGGLIGYIGCSTCDHSTIVVENCYTTGNVTINASSYAGTLIGQNGDGAHVEKTKYITLRNSYSIGNVTGTNVLGLIAMSIMNAENIFNGGQVFGSMNTGNIFGRLSATDSTITNSYSVVQNNPITNNTGDIVNLSDLKTTTWFTNTLGLDNNWKYEDGYYPQLYKLDDNGNPTTTLLGGQNKIKIQ